MSELGRAHMFDGYEKPKDQARQLVVYFQNLKNTVKSIHDMNEKILIDYTGLVQDLFQVENVVPNWAWVELVEFADQIREIEIKLGRVQDAQHAAMNYTDHCRAAISGDSIAD